MGWLDDIANWFGDAWDAIHSLFSNAGTNIADFMEGVLNGVIAALTTAGTSVYVALAEAIRDIIGWASDAWVSVNAFWDDVKNHVMDWIGELADTVTSWINSSFETVQDFANWLRYKFAQWIADAGYDMIKGMANYFLWTVSETYALFANLPNYLAKTWDSVKAYVTSAISSATASLTGLADDLINYTDNLGNSIAKWTIDTFTGFLSDFFKSLDDELNNLKGGGS